MTVEFDVRDLVGQPGSAREVHVRHALPGLATELASVPDDREVTADLQFESVVEGILVSGPVSVMMELACARCLRPLQGELRVEVQELFAPGAGPADDEYPMAEGFVDLEPMIRDALVPAMPFAPLCRPDCLGLCEGCGGDRNQGECACAPVVDARWAPLLELRLPDQEPGLT